MHWSLLSSLRRFHHDRCRRPQRQERGLQGCGVFVGQLLDTFVQLVPVKSQQQQFGADSLTVGSLLARHKLSHDGLCPNIEATARDIQQVHGAILQQTFPQLVNSIATAIH